jgi:hypothetical protein
MNYTSVKTSKLANLEVIHVGFGVHLQLRR